ncbi:hemerythrin domain-containing protein [Uliginosibacterium gangwonense]|uniref:hemerythrin domain-containing protein n=1 Tax=Uliginosibacterium gangwonense TaxID=392736 RepID=UPI00037FDEEC|nr:hemerythrin domain-containing protein [Uliginosibacterium gangwonense]
MKRSFPLIQLSREHHTALVLAKRAGTCVGDAAASAALLSRINSEYAPDLLAHFATEERELPGVVAPIAPSLILRLFNEHSQLRAFLARIHAGDVTALQPFGELLAAHVRFEERELFPCFETTSNN